MKSQLENVKTAIIVYQRNNIFNSVINYETYLVYIIQFQFLIFVNKIILQHRLLVISK